MTKKHLISLADTIRSLTTHDDGQTFNRDAVIEALADFCQAQNPNFNRQRWIAYIDGQCGPNGGKIKA